MIGRLYLREARRSHSPTRENPSVRRCLTTRDGGHVSSLSQRRPGPLSPAARGAATGWTVVLAATTSTERGTPHRLLFAGSRGSHRGAVRLAASRVAHSAVSSACTETHHSMKGDGR